MNLQTITARRTQLDYLPIILVLDGAGSLLLTFAEAVDIVDSLAAVLAEIEPEKSSPSPA